MATLSEFRTSIQAAFGRVTSKIGMWAAVLVVVMSSLPTIGQVPDDHRIGPGERIGPWTLDARLDDFIKGTGNS